jgi:hypothetical protein
MGKEKDSMPMKCIDQIPQPMTSAPPVNQVHRPDDTEIREAMLNVV